MTFPHMINSVFNKNGESETNYDLAKFDLGSFKKVLALCCAFKKRNILKNLTRSLIKKILIKKCVRRFCTHFPEWKRQARGRIKVKYVGFKSKVLNNNTTCVDVFACLLLLSSLFLPTVSPPSAVCL